MPVIKIETYIAADIQVVFNLSQSIDLHLVSASQTNEKAIAGKTTGLIGLGESVTWQARHFGINQRLSIVIAEFEEPYYFADEMTKGAFAAMRHEHTFKQIGDKVLMTDVFKYKSPLGILGKLADVLFLERYMRKFLMKRNRVLKEIAEDPNKYKKILPLYSGRIT
ncbi:cell division protein [Flavobacterium arcticum]|uniref:Cell division protein n=1 Tax=Flavobacterium arcticum TaxID=1784713 RepID=A0A345HC08_9FLAO|nr:SRPBCC family protein [Flavobacterium arcticum]AXG74118.1 cell division protein [Flavobacterium arcticum]KAF2507322.1 SRPBCC family protein [Flavobacterium arcticum]